MSSIQRTFATKRRSSLTDSEHQLCPGHLERQRHSSMAGTMSLEFAPWSSGRLSYRAVEQADEIGVRYELGRDAEAFNNAVPFVPTPQGSNAAKSYKQYLESCLLGVIICIAPPTPAKAEDSQPALTTATRLSACSP